MRRPSPSPIRRRLEPIRWRWSRTRDEKRAGELPQFEYRYSSRRSKDTVGAEVGTCVDKQTAGAQQRATKDSRLKRLWSDEGSYSSGDKRRNVEIELPSEHSTSTRSTKDDYRSYRGKGSDFTWREPWRPTQDQTKSRRGDSRAQQWSRDAGSNDNSRSPKKEDL